MNEQPIPDCLDGIYSRLGEWQPYNIKTGYIKKPCMVITKDGYKRGPCWPNARKFAALDGKHPDIPEAMVQSVAYFEE